MITSLKNLHIPRIWPSGNTTKRVGQKSHKVEHDLSSDSADSYAKVNLKLGPWELSKWQS